MERILEIEKLFSSSYCNEHVEKSKYYFDNILDENKFGIDINNLIKLEQNIILHFKN